jgi:hypothetical protein
MLLINSLIVITHCLNQLPFCALQLADGQTRKKKNENAISDDLETSKFLNFPAWRQPWWRLV